MSDNDIIELIEGCSEIDEYQFQIILSKHTIKVQTYMANKIDYNTELQKQACDSLRKINMLLETNTKHDEQNRKNLLSAIEAIKTTNIENKKNLLLAEFEEQNIINRKKINLKKYEEQWLNAKQRFENIASFQRYLPLHNTIETKRQNIKKFNKEIQTLNVNISIKRRKLVNLDKKFVVKVAEYIIHKRPAVMKQIRNKQIELDTLKKAINKQDNFKNCLPYSYKLSSVVTTYCTEYTGHINLKDTWSNLSINLGHAILPKLQLQNENCDLVTGFDQVKNINEECILSVEQTNNFDVETASNMQINEYRPEQNITDVYPSSYFTSPKTSSERNNEPDTYSNKKLIHILDDIKLDTVKTCSIISKFQPSEMKEVNLIKAGQVENNFNEKQILQEKVNKLMNHEDIEEIDFTKNSSQNILVPPTQFLDLTQNSQEERVISNSVVSVQKSTNLNSKINEFTIVHDNNASNEQMDDNFNNDNLKMHEMIVYEVNPEQKNQVTTIDNNLLKVQKDEQKNETPIFQPLLSDCLASTSNYFNCSMNTTITSGDFPQCIDSNVLLSPKADHDQLSIQDDNIEMSSEEVPNFLAAGFKKTSFSLFGAANTNNKADSNVQNQNNFNFNFGEEDRCNRGIFFNMF